MKELLQALSALALCLAIGLMALLAWTVSHPASIVDAAFAEAKILRRPADDKAGFTTQRDWVINKLTSDGQPTQDQLFGWRFLDGHNTCYLFIQHQNNGNMHMPAAACFFDWARFFAF